MGNISIHALVKRATVEPLFSGFVVVISIHALVKRATATVGKNIMPRLFQSTPS